MQAQTSAEVSQAGESFVLVAVKLKRGYAGQRVGVDVERARYEGVVCWVTYVVGAGG